MRTMTMLSTTMLWTVLATAAMGQTVPEVKLPTSPMGKAAIQVGGAWAKTTSGGQRYEGGKWIVVDYSRPLLRGRKDIFGSAAEYGKFVSDGSAVWRAGANATTKLTTQVPLSLGGKIVPPGTYSVMVDLKPGNWMLVLSSQPVQEKYDPNDKVKLYGAYNYDPKFDVVRVPMKVTTSHATVEEFTISFVDVTETSATLAMSWDKTIATATLGLTVR